MSPLDDYDYALPKELIAQHPLARREDARLLVVDRAARSIAHAHVRDLSDLLAPGDCLVLNDTRVLPARLLGRRSETGGRWEGLFLSADEQGHWRLLCKTRGRLKPGDAVRLVNRYGQDDVRLFLLEKQEEGIWLAHAESSDDTLTLLERLGRVPLPHYIRGGEMHEEDRHRYQTVFAAVPGSAAAPTAGLHFTERLLEQSAQRGIHSARVTLHVGLDTFRPIKVDNLAEHRMHTEWCQLDEASAAQLRAVEQAGRRVVAVGTTSVRVLETAARGGELAAWSGATDLFIRPPYQFQAVDAMLTNFHLPRSTLLVLVRTFGGDELIRRAYQEAIDRQYRFFSYGDAMLIL